MKRPQSRFSRPLAPTGASSSLEPLRQHAGDYGNHAIDEFLAGRLTRRELLRYASVLGLSGIAFAGSNTAL